MLEVDLNNLILENLHFSPNGQQRSLIGALSSFLFSHPENGVFVLNGYAGTGKTSVMGALVKALESLKKKTVVLAPTGRAAKVAANFASGNASTIHKRLYRGNSSDPSNHSFFLAPNVEKDTLFIVDEASMITDGATINKSLLLQLIRYVYNGNGCCMILVGDLAQLPPVGQPTSYAMEEDRLRNIGLDPVMFTLTEPARQDSESGILYNATVARHYLFAGLPVNEFSLYESGFDDVATVYPADLLDSLSSSYATVGKDETIVITRSNFRANNINNTIRRYILDAEGPVIRGEKIVITKNDYFWSKENKLKNFIANGEIAEVLNVGRKIKKYGRWFAELELKVPGISEIVNANLILRSLVSEGPSIPREEMERFYNRVLAATEGELSVKIKAALNNPFYNALQAKYGYCVTCHKAQGGQWKHVYVDLGGIPEDSPQEEFYRWIYTAITRATEKVFFVNPPFEVQ